MSRWLSLFVITRAVATATAVLLLTVHRVSPHDPILVAVTLVYGVGTIALVRSRPRVAMMPAAWAVDALLTLALVLAVSEWRSPFYLLQLTALVLPATSLRFRAAMGWGALYAAAYFAVALHVGIDPNTLESTTRLESFATHLMVPMLVALSLAYAAQLLDHLEDERERSERLAVEAERRRIAWELHDSAKQRVHAAHLLLSAGPRREDPVVAQAVGELRAATADMETSLGELRTPLLEGRRLAATLRERASELSSATDARIEVRGSTAALPPFIAAHAYRIAAEALTNAVRHARARHIEVRLHHDQSALRVVVHDDGTGLPASPRPGASGLRSMRERAESIGGALAIEAGAGGGTTVRLDIPLTTEGATP